jgi:hypothetical protein
MSINFKDKDMVATYKGYYDTAEEARNAYLAFKQEIDAEKAVI